MYRLVQFHGLRRSAGGGLGKSQLASRPSIWHITWTRRAFAVARDASNVQHDFTCGVVATTSPQQTSFEDLLDGVVPGRVILEDASTSEAGLLTLLVTPTYAQYALDTSLPLRVLRRLAAREAPEFNKPFDALTAVVDQLPVFTKEKSGVLGVEGLAYHFQAKGPGLRDEDLKVLDPSAQRARSLTFSTQPASSSASQWWTFALQLPLAQTIFSTGLPSTLLHARYIPDATEHMRLDSENLLDSHTVHFSSPLHTTSAPSMCASFPLVQLTPARTVRDSMGNIIRTLSQSEAYSPNDIPAASRPTRPASQELEAAVNAYFESQNMQPEPVSVWALVIPHCSSGAMMRIRRFSRLLTLQMSEIIQSWDSKESIPSEKGIASKAWIQKAVSRGFLHSLRKGARLCKVLSGGGGWGKKAGLLSLDPDSAYGESGIRAPPQSEGALNLTEGDNLHRDALGEVIKESDTILFFLAPKTLSAVQPPPVDAEAELSIVDPGSQMNVFGAIPSTIDTVPTLETPESNKAAKVTHHEDTFGMLSEGGMALTINREDGQVVTQTKLDIPYSWLGVAWPASSAPSPRDKGSPVHDNTSDEGEGGVNSTDENHQVVFGRQAESLFQGGFGSAKDVNPLFSLAPCLSFEISRGLVRSLAEWHATLRAGIATAVYDNAVRLRYKAFRDLYMRASRQRSTNSRARMWRRITIRFLHRLNASLLGREPEDAELTLAVHGSTPKRARQRISSPLFHRSLPCFPASSEYVVPIRPHLSTSSFVRTPPRDALKKYEKGVRLAQARKVYEAGLDSESAALEQNGHRPASELIRDRPRRRLVRFRVAYSGSHAFQQNLIKMRRWQRKEARLAAARESHDATAELWKAMANEGSDSAVGRAGDEQRERGSGLQKDRDALLYQPFHEANDEIGQDTLAPRRSKLSSEQRRALQDGVEAYTQHARQRPRAS